ncbi:MAG: hypothetical protein EPO02_10775 [Nitrospirae bacterium]|nr:MAG: hypothetical protein EPO02_10775 [Nitrospirota bacterium]
MIPAALLLLLFWGGTAVAAPPLLSPPEGFRVLDTPNDAGKSLSLVWKASPSDSKNRLVQVWAAESPQAAFNKVAEFPSNTRYVKPGDFPWWAQPAGKGDHYVKLSSSQAFPIENGKRYTVKLLMREGGREAWSDVAGGTAAPNYFNTAQINNLVFVLAFTGVLLGSIAAARRNPHVPLRRIAGLDAVEEAIGRSTEMGRPILYLTGAGDMSEVPTIAATVILGEVAKKVAHYDTTLKVPHRDPIVMAVCQEIVKEAYVEAGRPDAYKDESNFFITGDQFSYTAAVDGIMLREKPAANFFMGSYFAESLLLTETGASTGAIQIAGTDSDHQLPFFVTTCDYTLIGEELYAASAYLSREPVLVGTLRGQDFGKAFIMGVLVLGTALATVGVVADVDGVNYVLDLFKDFK